VPPTQNALDPLHGTLNCQGIAIFLRQTAESKRISDPATPDTAPDANTFVAGADSPEVENVLDQVMNRPWSSQQLPPLAKWVVNNEKPLDLLLEASKRPRYYAPSPTLINNQRNLLIEMLLPLTQSVRESGRSLSARAMWHLGESRPDRAWQDLHAVHRLSRLFTQGTTLIDQLIALATSGLACDGTVTLLHHGQLSSELAEQIQRDLSALPSFNVMSRSLGKFERAAALDAFIRVGSGGSGEAFSAMTGGSNDDYGATALNVVSVDWNLVLRETNGWYDRLTAAAEISNYAERQAALEQIDTDIRQLFTQSREPTNVLAGLVSRQQRSKLVSAIMLSLFLPALEAATEAQDRENADLELVRVAAALAVYRAEHGAYPETLDELVPGVLAALPADFYNNKPYVYLREGEGYLLYSQGKNGTDDGGSHEQWKMYRGRRLDDFDEQAAANVRPAIRTGADDISIRVPRPAFELPELPPADGEQ
jgi:hypothetical protein